jgi:hypothetical protein
MTQRTALVTRVRTAASAQQRLSGCESPGQEYAENAAGAICQTVATSTATASQRNSGAAGPGNPARVRGLTRPC